MFQKIRFLWLLFPVFVLSCSFIVDFTSPTNREICDNGRDDDNDEGIDCDDPDCSTDPVCEIQLCNGTKSWNWNDRMIGLYFSEVFGVDTCPPNSICSVQQNADHKPPHMLSTYTGSNSTITHGLLQ